MRILLDTHIAIWAVQDSEELSDEARAMILDESNEIYRMLLAQAKSERMKFMTHDALISYYNESFIISV